MDIGTYVNKTLPVVVSFQGGETANLQINSRKLSAPAVFQAQALAGGDTNDPEQVAKIEPASELMLADFVTSWDLLWEGADFPPTLDNIRRLPFLVKFVMLQEITEAIQGDPKPSTVSPEPSNTAASEAESIPIGTPFSSSPPNGEHHPGMSPESMTLLAGTPG